MLSVYVEHLISELLRNHGGMLVSVMEPEIRVLIQSAVNQERERAAQEFARRAVAAMAYARANAAPGNEYLDYLSDVWEEAAAFARTPPDTPRDVLRAIFSPYRGQRSRIRSKAIITSMAVHSSHVMVPVYSLLLLLLDCHYYDFQKCFQGSSYALITVCGSSRIKSNRSSSAFQ